MVLTYGLNTVVKTQEGSVSLRCSGFFTAPPQGGVSTAGADRLVKPVIFRSK